MRNALHVSLVFKILFFCENMDHVPGSGTVLGLLANMKAELLEPFCEHVFAGHIAILESAGREDGGFCKPLLSSKMQAYGSKLKSLAMNGAHTIISVQPRWTVVPGPEHWSLQVESGVWSLWSLESGQNSMPDRVPYYI